MLRKHTTLKSVATTRSDGQRRIESATLIGPDGTAVTAQGQVFLDATYEGDLLAKAGIPFRVGREGREQFGETLAPERGDGQLQAYNFRFIMTKDPANRVTPVEPLGYRREDFVGVLPLLESGKSSESSAIQGAVSSRQTPLLPNGKYDINDVSTGLVRLSLPGRNLAWPDGDAASATERPQGAPARPGGLAVLPAERPGGPHRSSPRGSGMGLVPR